MNNQFYYIEPNKNPDRWLASFSIFKSLNSSNTFRYDERPPYPVIISQPSFFDVLNNLNKSDFLLYQFILVTGFMSSFYSTRYFNLLQAKLFYNRLYMITFHFVGLLGAYSASHYRLTGLMDNGLRWRRPDYQLRKYDFTRDFEEKTIFKHFRERFY